MRFDHDWPHSRVLLLVPLLFVLLPRSASTAAQQNAPSGSIDLAAMVLTPTDLAAVGWDGLGLQAGQTLAVSDLAARAVWPTGTGAKQDAMRNDLLAAGWQQGYTVTLATLWDPHRSDLGRQVEIELEAYADAAGAAQGWARVPDVFPTGTITPVTGEREIGEALAPGAGGGTRSPGGNPQPGTGPWLSSTRTSTAHILVRDWSDGQPRRGDGEAVAERLLARVEQVLRDGGPGLSLHALRLEPREHAAQTAAYRRTGWRRCAVDLRVANGVRGPRRALWDSHRRLHQRHGDRGGGRRDPLEVDVDLLRFPTPTRAAAWLGAAATRFGAGEDGIALAVEDRVAGIGDEAVVVTEDRDPGRTASRSSHTSGVLLRVGAVVAQCPRESDQ